MSNNTHMIERIIRQNEVIISLLGRIAFTPDVIRKIVTSRKQNPDKYIEGYNACNGNHTLNEIANIVGVKSGTISPILSNWEEIGIIFEVSKTGGKYYKKLYQI